jgi:hypothetical protein
MSIVRSRRFRNGCARAVFFAASALMLSTADARASTVYPGCTPPPTTYARTIAGNPVNLPSLLAKAEGGDLIVLAAGDYGPVHLNKVNASFVTLAAAKGQRPMFDSLGIRGSHWIVRGVTVVGLSPPHLYGTKRAHIPLVTMLGGDNFILEDDTVASRLGTYPWVEEKIPGDPNQPAVSDGVTSNQSSCVAIVADHIFNVFNGIQVAGDQSDNHGRFYVLANNTIDNFAGDGIDHSVSDALIKGNLITDGHDICHNNCVHMDGIQGWTYNDRRGIVNSNVVIDANRIIVQTTPGLVLPADELQGITVFDGSWKNVRVTNNIVIANVWQGISLGGVDGLLIANNDVLSTTSRTTWILVGSGTHEGGVSDHQIVRNNIATVIKMAKTQTPVPHVTIDHNIQTADPKSLFVAYDVKSLRYDLHLKPHSPAVGKGNSDQAPPLDIDGQPRHPPINLGVYR